MTLVDIALLNAALAERDAAREEKRVAVMLAEEAIRAEEREENARLRDVIEKARDTLSLGLPGGDKAVGSYLTVALAVPTADDGAERGARHE